MSSFIWFIVGVIFGVCLFVFGLLRIALFDFLETNVGKTLHQDVNGTRYYVEIRDKE